MLNEELIKINGKVIEEIALTDKEKLNIEECNAKLINYIEKKEYLDYEKKLSLDDGEKLSFTSIIEETNSKDEYVIFRLGQSIGDFLDSIVKERMPTEILSFDMDGIKRLSKLLKARNVDSRNYNYIDDFLLLNQML